MTEDSIGSVLEHHPLLLQAYNKEQLAAGNKIDDNVCYSANKDDGGFMWANGITKVNWKKALSIYTGEPRQLDSEETKLKTAMLMEEVSDERHISVAKLSEYPLTLSNSHLTVLYKILYCPNPSPSASR